MSFNDAVIFEIPLSAPAPGTQADQKLHAYLLTRLDAFYQGSETASMDGYEYGDDKFSAHIYCDSAEVEMSNLATVIQSQNWPPNSRILTLRNINEPDNAVVDAYEI